MNDVVSDAASSTPLRYGVVGNPVAHSLSPEIHAAFARQAGLSIDYRRIVAPLDGFVATIERFFADGGRGLNVTLPFKLDAYAACGARVGARARQAGAVNCMTIDEQGLSGDNTDGIGLVRDLQRLVTTSGHRVAGARVLLVGAGGSARGVVGPLLACGPERLTIVNRDAAKARALVDAFRTERAGRGTVEARTFDALDGERYDVIVNATSASLASVSLPLPPSIFLEAWLAYDLMYGAAPTGFMREAQRAGASATADGFGMLVEQAAESFFLWHGVRPETTPVLDLLRAMLARKAAS